MSSIAKWSPILIGLGIVAGLSFTASECSLVHAQDAKALNQSGVEREFFSSQIRPGEDFFRYVNDRWLEETEIPDDQSNYGSFTILDIQTKESIRKIIDDASTSRSPSPIERQVGDFYRSYVDVETRNEAGIKPIQGLIDDIRQLKDHSDAMALSGRLSRRGIPSFFGTMIEPDAKRSDQYAVYVSQDGTTLPDRDYYSEESEASASIRAAFFRYVRDMLNTIGWTDAEQNAAKIVDLETRLAEAQWDKVMLRDPVKSYNKISVNDFAGKNPGLAWKAYAEATGLSSQDELIVGQPSFFESAQKIIADESIPTIQAYLAFKTVDTYAPVLSETLEKMHFAFHETVLSGVTEQEPLWRRGVDACNARLGMPVGQLYVERHFSPRAKERMNELVANLLKAFEQRIEQLEWMGSGTKAQAKQKLAEFTPKIGYPDRWKDYSSVQMDANDIVGNLMRLAEFEHQYALNKLGKPIDRTEWYMPPQTVNAYYNPLMNEIVFPAAILQPPFFNLEADDAVNYGAIGAVIGHEISHGFDDSGSRFDGKGNLRNWWTENDRTEFEKRANRLVAQYDAYEPLPGMNLSGKFTLGENIGDLGGLSVAYTAYQLSLDGKPAPMIDGFTGPQRFFVGWAQVWRRKYREEEMRKRIKTDPHSPSAYRCNGIVSNLDSFYDAFGIQSGDAMYLAPEDRVRIW
ncbi:MAG: M13 family metallopeptidase [Pirellula sp.]|jgi:endothelin-converting enzyme/putative endopeptidase|nr:M13 family metallopeptidase [Pirellula sp.]